MKRFTAVQVSTGRKVLGATVIKVSTSDPTGQLAADGQLSTRGAGLNIVVSDLIASVASGVAEMLIEMAHTEIDGQLQTLVSHDARALGRARAQ